MDTYTGESLYVRNSLLRAIELTKSTTDLDRCKIFVCDIGPDTRVFII